MMRANLLNYDPMIYANDVRTNPMIITLGTVQMPTSDGKSRSLTSALARKQAPYVCVPYYSIHLRHLADYYILHKFTKVELLDTYYSALVSLKSTRSASGCSFQLSPGGSHEYETGYSRAGFLCSTHVTEITCAFIVEYETILLFCFSLMLWFKIEINTRDLVF